jgi:hypothetical protein
MASVNNYLAPLNTGHFKNIIKINKYFIFAFIFIADSCISQQVSLDYTQACVPAMTALDPPAFAGPAPVSASNSQSNCFIPGSNINSAGPPHTGAVFGFDMVQLQSSFLKAFASQRLALLERWQQTLIDAAQQPEPIRLEIINDFFNSNILAADDMSVWQQNDYWATPLELIGQGRGDCEDFAIAKYYSLIVAGTPTEKLRLVYVKASTNSASGKSLQAHMVLAYFPLPSAEPLLLDNLDIEIKPASLRRDLQPIFSFNSQAIWPGFEAGSQRNSDVDHLSRWQDLQLRVQGQGIHETRSLLVSVIN